MKHVFKRELFLLILNLFYFIFLRIVTRIQTTLRGSVDDIGWLVNNPDYPAAEDGTEDFLRALEQIG